MLLNEFTKEHPDSWPFLKNLIDQKRRTNFNLSPGMVFTEIVDGDPEIMSLIENLINIKKEANPHLTRGMAFCEIVDKNPKLVAKIGPEIQTSLDPELRAALLSELIKLKLEEKNLYYSEAFSEVQKENPELALLYSKDIRK